MMNKVFVLCAFCAALFAQNSRDGAFFVDVNTTCSVKFIDVFKAPNFIATLEYNDYEKVVFSSPKAMFYYMYEISAREHFSPIKKISK